VKFIAGIIAGLLLVVPAGSALAPGAWKITLQANVIEQRGDVKVYALYNKPTYPRRIGTAFITCNRVSRDFTDCLLTLRLGRGQVLARGIVPASSSFRQLGVVGGTGIYSNTGGQMSMQPLGESVVLVLVDLLAYS
jgi:hypothetical protein